MLSRGVFRPLDVLNANEKHRLDTCIELWRRAGGPHICDADDLVVHLGDQPTLDGQGWKTWSLTSGAVPTLRRSSGIMWAVGRERPLTLKEQYASMGFCSFLQLASIGRVSLYSVFKPQLSYSQARQALGNAQHVASVGVFSLCALAAAVPLQPL